MKNTLWQDDDGTQIDQAIMEFMAGEDVVLDRELFPYDIQATAAHVRGLARIGILSADESATLCRLLEQLKQDFAAGRFILDERFEDGHSAIEMFLTGEVGDSGAKVHTGRSRNDQVAVATRLFLKDSLARLAALNGRIAQACLERAERHANVPMPGYTHLQRAVPSSIGLWMGGFAVLAQHRDETQTRVWILTLPVALNPYPLHFPASGELLFADDWDVILRLASSDTGTTATTAVKIDGHRPGVIEFIVITGFAVFLPFFCKSLNKTHDGITLIGMLFKPAFCSAEGGEPVV